MNYKVGQNVIWTFGNFKYPGIISNIIYNYRSFGQIKVSVRFKAKNDYTHDNGGEDLNGATRNFYNLDGKGEDIRELTFLPLRPLLYRDLL